MNQNYFPLNNHKSQLSKEDERDICDSVSECLSTNNYVDNHNVSVNGNGIGTRKPTLNFELTDDKLRLFSELKKCNYRTHRDVVARLLSDFFDNPNTYPTHWPWHAQYYTPKTICSVIYQEIIKPLNVGEILINPAGKFTDLIKFRAKRKKFRKPNGGNKPE